MDANLKISTNQNPPVNKKWLCIIGDPVDCSPPGSSIHGILQARILEWVAISFSRGSSRIRNRTRVSHIAGSDPYFLYRCSTCILNAICIQLVFIYSFSSPPSQLPPSMCAGGDGAGSVCPFFLISSTKSTRRENQGRFWSPWSLSSASSSR